MTLVLDDEPRWIQSYLDAFELEGIENTVVVTPYEFFEALARMSSIKSVVIDVMLGDDIDGGIEVWRRLRRTHPTLPVILLTNRTLHLDLESDNCTRIFEKAHISPSDLCAQLRLAV
jgi:two-component system OmpR family response regulator